MSDQQSISKIDNDDINNELKDKIVNIFDETDDNSNDIDTNSKRLIKEKFAILKQKFKNSL